MAAIDKIYITSLKQYDEFAEWCRQQPMLTDKYGYQESITKYLYPRPTSDRECCAFMAPYFVDAYVIRNCPLDYIQEELKINYGSDYDDIKSGKLYTKPTTDCEYVVGKHCKVVKIPIDGHCNRPYKTKSWWVDVVLPEDTPYPYMVYHTGGKKKPDTWDFCDEFVIDYEWGSSSTMVKTISALKRRIPKWKLPVGTKVRATGPYIGDEWEFLVTK